MSILSSLFAPTKLEPETPVVVPPEPTRPERILVVGAGPVGHVLASGLERAGFPLRHWSRKLGPLWQESTSRRPADVVLLAVRDEGIAQAAAFVVEQGAAGPNTVLLHCAGALAPQEVLGAQVGQVAGIGLLHPLRSFAQPLPATNSAAQTFAPIDLTGTVLAVCGDQRGLQAAELLATALGGVVVKLTPERLPAYHAAAVMAAGHVASLLDIAVHLLRRLGLDQRSAEVALASLSRSVIDNIADVGLPQALTGPIARGDADTVAKHLLALNQISCEVTTVYRTLSYTALDVAYRQGIATPEALQRIQGFLDASNVEKPPAR